MQHRKFSNAKPNTGFTLVEVIIIAPIIILAIGIFIGVMMTITGDVMASREVNAMTFDIQDALGRIKQDVKYSAGYLATNSVAITSPQGLNDDTTAFHNVTSNPLIGQTLILNTYTTSANPQSSSKSLVYLENQPNACNSINVNKNTTLMMNVVYFVKTVNGVSGLWRRVLSPSNYATTGCIDGSIQSPWQRPSCSPGYVNAFCKAEDVKLIDGVTVDNFTISYGDDTTLATPIADATNSSLSDATRQAAIQTAGSASITITSIRTISGRDISQSGTIRVILSK